MIRLSYFFVLFLLESTIGMMQISCICTLDLDCGFVLFLRQICFDNFLVVFCKMDYEGHLLIVNKVFTNFFLGKKNLNIDLALVDMC